MHERARSGVGAFSGARDNPIAVHRVQIVEGKSLSLSAQLSGDEGRRMRNRTALAHAAARAGSLLSINMREMRLENKTCIRIIL